MSEKSYEKQLDKLIDVEPQKLDSYAEGRGSRFQKINPNQIRNLYGPITQLRSRFNYGKSKSVSQSNSAKAFVVQDEVYKEIVRGLTLMKPKLAYAVALSNNKDRQTMEELRTHLNTLIDMALKEENDGHFAEALTNFFEVIEAIVAYHKYYLTKRQ